MLFLPVETGTFKEPIEIKIPKTDGPFFYAWVTEKQGKDSLFLPARVEIVRQLL